MQPIAEHFSLLNIKILILFLYSVKCLFTNTQLEANIVPFFQLDENKVLKFRIRKGSYLTEYWTTIVCVMCETVYNIIISQLHNYYK